MLELNDNLPNKIVPLEAKLLLFALSSKSGFLQTKVLQELHTCRNDPLEQKNLLHYYAKRLEAKDWRFADREIQAAVKENISVYSILCPEYPELLREIADPPLVLFCRGTLLRTRHVAVVGARRASDSGLQTAFQVAQLAAEYGDTVVSGLALGIDAAAHRGALAGRKGATVAVLGSGVCLPQPRHNLMLAEKIIEQGGALLSEFGVHTGAQRHHFPRRNRIIAGLSRKVVVVEAAQRSGSLITARLALEQGRDVLAVPGPPLSLAYAGCNALVKQGAELLLEPEDVLSGEKVVERSFPAVAQRRALAKVKSLGLDASLSACAETVVNYLAAKAQSSWDELDQTLETAELTAVILPLMELEGIIFQRGGQYSLGEEFDSV